MASSAKLEIVPSERADHEREPLTPSALNSLRTRLLRLRAVVEQTASLGHRCSPDLASEVAVLTDMTVLVDTPCIGCKTRFGVPVAVDDPCGAIPRVIVCGDCEDRITG